MTIDPTDTDWMAVVDLEFDRLRAALVGLVGVDGKDDLEQLECGLRLLPAPAEDKARTIDAVHALLATLPAVLTRGASVKPPESHPMELNRFIVAEISKNWVNGQSPTSQILAQLFEGVITRNAACGYALLSFQLHRLVVSPDEINETIIAVFERRS